MKAFYLATAIVVAVVSPVSAQQTDRDLIIRDYLMDRMAEQGISCDQVLSEYLDITALPRPEQDAILTPYVEGKVAEVERAQAVNERRQQDTAARLERLNQFRGNPNP